MSTTQRDYYEVLGVPRTATQKQIKAAFRRLARKHHPDVNPNHPDAVSRFKEINEAHEVLGDPEKRRKYDELGPGWREHEAWERAGRPAGGPFGQAGDVEYRTVSPEDLEDLFGSDSPFSAFFHDTFGRGRAGRAGRAGSGFTATASAPGQDVEAETSVSLEEAYRGSTRAFELLDGGGRRRVELRIPPGVRDGSRLRMAGQGGPGTGGRPAGDLFARVHLQPHPTFTREGDDLRVRVPVPLDVALLGGEVEVPTLRGRPVALRIPPETQNRARLRLRGLGMPRLDGSGAGDLYAETDVRLPVPLSPEVKEMAARLRRGAGAGSES
ncbi:MAG TPA: DnaJ C-terminal domain-containing protein [Candidatus Dormibacteraeota bacterium]|nr:DnaJ C-terminal domain-containing protein [Candidatus Dormibacteraeota bacterium]